MCLEAPQSTNQVSMVTCLEQEQEHLHGTSISMVTCPKQNKRDTRIFPILKFAVVILANTFPIHDTDNDQGGNLVIVFLNNPVDDEASIHTGSCPHSYFFITV
jgi:hypothetical protein